MTSRAIDTEDVVAAIIDHYADSGDVSREQLIEQIAELISSERQSLSDRIDVLEAGAELLFKRLEHLRDTSGTETRLERGNRAAYHSALEIARATLNPRAALHQEGIAPK